MAKTNIYYHTDKRTRIRLKKIIIIIIIIIINIINIIIIIIIIIINIWKKLYLFQIISNNIKIEE